MFLIGTLSFQEFQQIMSDNNISVSIDTINSSWEIRERYSFKMKLDSKHDKTISTEPSVNEVMETIMAGETDPSTQDPIDHVTDENSLMKLFDQFSSLISPV